MRAYCRSGDHDGKLVGICDHGGQNPVTHFLLALLLLFAPARAAEMKDFLRAQAAYQHSGDSSEAGRQRYILKLIKLAKDFEDTGDREALRAVRGEMLAHPAPGRGAAGIDAALIVGPWSFPHREKFFRDDGTFASYVGAPGEWQLSGNHLVEIGGLDFFEKEASRAHSGRLEFTLILLSPRWFVLANDQLLSIGERLREPKALVAASAEFARAGETRESARIHFIRELLRLRQVDEENQWQYSANLICLRLTDRLSDRDIAVRLPGTWVSPGYVWTYSGDGTCREEGTGQRGTWRVENDQLIRGVRDEEGFIHPFSRRVILLGRDQLVTTDEKEVFAETRKSR
jgi:hypothetical protein